MRENNLKQDILDYKEWCKQHQLRGCESKNFKYYMTHVYNNINKELHV